MSDFKDEPPTLKSDTPISRLQERIATAIWNEVECDEFTIGDAKSAADAVIRELRLDRILYLAQDWYQNYDMTPANDPRNPSDVDIAYDDAGFQILNAIDPKQYSGIYEWDAAKAALAVLDAAKERKDIGRDG